jgi:hypothetical protein
MAKLLGWINELETGGAAREEKAFDFLGGVGTGLVELNEAIVVDALCRPVFGDYGNGGEQLLFVGAEHLDEFTVFEGLEDVRSRGQYFARNFHGTIEVNESFVFAERTSAQESGAKGNHAGKLNECRHTDIVEHDNNPLMK